MILERLHVADQFVDQRLARDRLTLGHPQQVVGLAVDDQQVAQILAGRKDLQQVRQRLGIALEQRGRRHRVARGGDESLEVVDRHVGIGEPGRGHGELVADLGEQIERDALRRHPRQVGVGRVRIDDVERPQPRFGFGRVVEIIAQAVDVDHDKG